MGLDAVFGFVAFFILFNDEVEITSVFIQYFPWVFIRRKVVSRFCV